MIIDFLKERINKILGNPFPLKYVYLNTTGGTCTNKCYMCPARGYQQNLKKMPNEIFEKAVQELRLADFDGEIHLYAQNEPFMDKDIFKKIEYVNKYLPNAQIALISNFTLLNDKIIDNLLSCPIKQLSNSIYGLKAENYQKITGKNNFQRTFINQVKFLKKFGQNQSLSFAMYLMDNEHNQNDIDFCKFFLFTIAPITIGTFYSTGSFFNTIHKEKTRHKYFISTCINNHLLIDSSGEVSICSIDCGGKMAVGSIYHNSIQEIFNSNVAKKIRKKMLKFNGPDSYCKICDFGKTEHYILYFLPLPKNFKKKLTQKLLSYYGDTSFTITKNFTQKEISDKLSKFNQIFKDGEEENWINCLNELRRKFYAKEL